MAALIEFVCREHTEAHATGPLITPVEGRWGYCQGNGDRAHKWTRIEPTNRARMEDPTWVEESRAS